MSFRDYICCEACGSKVVYDGDDNGREGLDSRYGTREVTCPECVARLRAENGALTQQVNRLDDTLDGWMCAALPDGWIGALRAENERLKADAARYRHLKAHHVREYPDDNGTLCIEFFCALEDWDDIDAVIDAAMAQGK